MAGGANRSPRRGSKTAVADRPVPGFRRTGDTTLYAGSLVSVVLAGAAGPHGERVEREVVRHPGAVTVVPVDGPYVYLVRQYRVAVDAELLELPAGKRDVSGEPPETTARRELQEEIGMTCGSLRKLAEFYNSPGFCDERSFVYLAGELEPATSSPQGVEEQNMSVVRILLRDSTSMVASGEIVDAKTIVGLALAKEAVS